MLKPLFCLILPSVLLTQVFCEEVQPTLEDFLFPDKEESEVPDMAASGVPDKEKVEAQVSEPCPTVACCSREVMPILEVKAGYFFFANHTMRKIYDDGGLDVQLSGSCPVLDGLNLYGSVEYLSKHGRSLSGDQRTSVWMLPVSLGIKPIFFISPRIQYYFAIGPRYFYFHQHNHSSYVPTNASRNGIGGFVNTGFNFLSRKNLLIDVFGEYSYEKTHFHSYDKTHVEGEKVQVGGFVFGGGLGYAF